jgi:CheY-like chemotaxis protein
LRPDEAVAEDAVGPFVESGRLHGADERVLVVEDNARLRAVLLRQLDDLGYRPIEAENAAAALSLLDGDAPVDLLLTDIIMPGKIDGLQLAREFRARRPSGKVLLTSGFPGTRLTDLDELGADLRLLDKPYRKQDLARILREVLSEPTPAG